MPKPSESRHHAALLDALLDPAILIDREGRALQVNTAWLEHIGWTQAELQAGGFAPVFDDEALAASLRNPVALLARQESGTLAIETLHVRKRSGGSCPAVLQLSALAGPAGEEPVLLLHLRAQCASRPRLESFKALFESAEDFVFMKDTDQRYLAINPSMCRLFERAEADLIGQRAADLFPPAVAERMEATDQRVLAGEQVAENIEISTESGERQAFHVLKSPIRGRGGVVTGICGIARDISRTEELRRELEAQGRRLQGITDHMPGIVFSYLRDAEGKQRNIYRSSGLATLVGAENASRVQSAEIDYVDLIHPEDRGALPYAHTLRGEPILRLDTEYRIQDGQGGYRWVHAQASGHKLAEGVMWHGVVLDVQERKRMEEELRNLNAMLSEVAAQVPGVVYSYRMHPNRHREILYFSPDLVKLVGPGNAAMLGEDLSRFDELIHPQDLEVWWEGDQDLGDGRIYFDLEYRILHDDGSYRWVHSRANGHRRPDGGALWNGIILDIDDRKRIEAELVEAGHRLQSLADGMPGAVYTYTSDEDFREDRVLYISSGAEALVGPRTAVRLREESGIYDTLIHPDDLARCVPRIRESSSDRLLFDKEYRLRGDDGEYRWVHDLAYGYPQADGQVIWHGMLFDIDAGKRAEAQLELANVQLASISDNLPGMVYSYIRHPDRSRTPIHISKSHLVELLGPKNGSRLMADLDTMDELLHPDDRSRIPEPRSVGEDGRLLFEMEYRLRKDCGAYRWVHARSYGFPREDGSVAWHGFLLDIDDRRRARDQLRLYSRSLERSLDKLNEAKAQAEQASQAKSQFLANMSHEIRTPLTAVLGFSELLCDRLEQPENREILTMILTNGRHLLELINDILDLARIEAGRFQAGNESIDPRAELRSAIEMMAPRARDKGLALELRMADELAGEVEGDATRLRQIFLNLIGNAVKFTSDGSVTVLARERREAGRELCVEVKDTGLGISAEASEHLFDAFVQGENLPNSGGTGLGLTISRELVELMGGRIEVESVLGQGSCFRVLLPLRASTRELEPDAPALGLRLEAMDVYLLLAEDNFTNQRLIQALLAKAGCAIDVVDDGAKAVERVLSARTGERPYDAVLMDIQMPILDGLAATRALREAGVDTPILALTAHALETDRSEAKAAGCDAHISKPIDRTKLVEALVRLIAAHRSGRVPTPERG